MKNILLTLTTFSFIWSLGNEKHSITDFIDVSDEKITSQTKIQANFNGLSMVSDQVRTIDQSIEAENFPSPYCEVNYSGVMVSPITTVQFGEIDNSSSDASMGNNPHEDFTSIISNVSLGESLELKVSSSNPFGTINYGAYAYIDWDQNEEFDLADEMYFIGEIQSSGNLTASTQITIPENAQLGHTRMRIILRYMGENPCELEGIGQAEDYTLNIIENEVFPAPYCEVDLATIYALPVTLVQFAGIDQSSSNDIWSPKHENFTDVIGEVEQSKTYPVKIKANTDGDYYTAVRMFIDWNQNGEFEANEYYDLGWLKNSDGTEEDEINDETINYILSDITVPEDAIPGETRMRIINIFTYTHSIPDYPMYSEPCGWNDIDNYGQAEDYTINVIPYTNTICEPSEPGENIGDTGCVNFTYQGETVGLTTVRAADGNIWLQQNLGSSQVANAYDDEAAYGDLFQWGRFDDGHQLRNSSQTDIYPEPNNPIGLGIEGNPNYFVGGGSAYGSNYDGWWGAWTIDDKWEAASEEEITATNALDPCKAIGEDWFIPTESDWETVLEAEGIIENHNNGNIDNIVFAHSSNLKLTTAGVRRDNELAFVGARGYYWSRSTSDTEDFVKYLYYSNFIVNPNAGDAKKQGSSIRCMKSSNQLNTSDELISKSIVYPNPTKNLITISTNKNIIKSEIFNLNGQRVHQFKDDKDLNLSHLNKGVYFLKIQFDDLTHETIKIIKK